MSIKRGFAGGCDLTPGQPPVVPVLTGISPSEFEHALIGDFTIRLYLLATGTSTLAIEVDDLPGGTGLTDYAAIVNQFVFAAP